MTARRSYWASAARGPGERRARSSLASGPRRRDRSRASPRPRRDDWHRVPEPSHCALPHAQHRATNEQRHQGAPRRNQGRAFRAWCASTCVWSGSTTYSEWPARIRTSSAGGWLSEPLSPRHSCVDQLFSSPTSPQRDSMPPSSARFSSSSARCRKSSTCRCSSSHTIWASWRSTATPCR